MKQSLLNLRNRLLTGRERHPWDHHYQVRRCDVKPGLKVIVGIKNMLVNAAPHITKDSQFLDALAHPEKYNWFGQGNIRIGTVEMIHLIFTSNPYLKGGHWFAKATDEIYGGEAEYSLFALGIVPDYIFNPNREGLDPAGWNPNSEPHFN